MSSLGTTLQNYISSMEAAESDSNQKTSHSDVSQYIIQEIDRGIKDKENKQPRRKYLGASSLGEECARKIQYRYMGQQVDEGKGFPPKTLRTFSLGHAIEDLMIMYFRDAGFDLRTEKGGEQFGFAVAEGEIKGHIDGVIVGGPLPIQYPMLWECKSANDRKFAEFVRKGVAEANPVYAAQVAMYQAYMDLTDNPCCFTVLNKNTSEIHIELIPFNQDLAQSTSDKAVNIIRATRGNDMLPRIAQNDDFFMCKWCEFRNTCWDK